MIIIEDVDTYVTQTTVSNENCFYTYTSISDQREIIKFFTPEIYYFEKKIVELTTQLYGIYLKYYIKNNKIREPPNSNGGSICTTSR
jgi:hypothetical protein